VRSGQPLYLVFAPGADWCYTVARTPECDCRQAQACQLKVARAADAPGVDLVEASDARFDPAAADPPGGDALWRGMDGTRSLQVVLTPLGRAKVCSPTGLTGYVDC
jgi:type IV fimbrial biogenesis protein FimT